MSNVTSVSLYSEAYQVVQDYMDKNNCSRNKAINELLKAVGEKLDLDTKRSKAILKVSLSIDKKLDEIKAILTKGSEE